MTIAEYPSRGFYQKQPPLVHRELQSLVATTSFFLLHLEGGWMRTFMIDVCGVPGVDVSSMVHNGYPLLPQQLLVPLTCFCTPPKMIRNGFDPR